MTKDRGSAHTFGRVGLLQIAALDLPSGTRVRVRVKVGDRTSDLRAGYIDGKGALQWRFPREPITVELDPARKGEDVEYRNFMAEDIVEAIIDGAWNRLAKPKGEE